MNCTELAVDDPVADGLHFGRSMRFKGIVICEPSETGFIVSINAVVGFGDLNQCLWGQGIKGV